MNTNRGGMMLRGLGLVLVCIAGLASIIATNGNGGGEPPFKWKQLLLIGKDPFQAMNAVVATNDNQLIAVGQDGKSVSVWRSSDGESWLKAWTGAQGEYGTVMSDIIIGDSSPKFIAVGQQDSKAAVWTSTDGTTWNRVYQYVQPGAPSSEMHAIARTTGSYIAVGWATEALPSPGAGTTIVAAVWRSADGNSWQRIAHSEAAFRGPVYLKPGEVPIESVADIRMADVIATDVGFIGVGWSDQIPEEMPCAWKSNDGISWTRPWCSSEVGRAQAVIKHGDRLVAVGRTGRGPGYLDGAVWHSTDGGTTWQRLTATEDALGGAGDQSLNAIIVSEGRLLAVGHNTGCESQAHSSVWSSVDGLSWAPVSSTTQWQDPHRDTEMRGLVRYGEKYVAVGISRSGGNLNYEFEEGYGAQQSDYDAAVWRADSISSWTRIPCNEALCGGKADQTLTGISAGPVLGSQAYLIVGFEKLDGDTDGAVWHCMGGPSAEQPYCTYQTSDVFRGAGNQKISGIVYGAGKWVAVGSDDSGGNLDAAVWVSSNGYNWSRVAQPGVLGGPGDQEMFRVVRGDDYFVAVGRRHNGTDYDGAVWYSQNGLSWELGSDEVMITRFGGLGDISVFDALPIYGPLGYKEFILVGEHVLGGVTYAAIWWSTGSPNSWTLGSGPSLEPFRGEGQSIRAIDHGIVAVGAGGISDDGHQMVARWTSEDGRDWTVSRSYSIHSTLTYNDVAWLYTDTDGAVIMAIVGTEKPNNEEWTYGYISKRMNNGRWYGARFGASGRNQTINSIISYGNNPIVVGSEEKDGELNGSVWYFTPNPDFRP